MQCRNGVCRQAERCSSAKGTYEIDCPMESQTPWGGIVGKGQTPNGRRVGKGPEAGDGLSERDQTPNGQRVRKQTPSGRRIGNQTPNLRRVGKGREAGDGVSERGQTPIGHLPIACELPICRRADVRLGSGPFRTRCPIGVWPLSDTPSPASEPVRTRCPIASGFRTRWRRPRCVTLRLRGHAEGRRSPGRKDSPP